MWFVVVAEVIMMICLVDESTCFVNVAYSPRQRLQGYATMNEPPQRFDWSASRVIDGNTNQTAIGSSCAIIDFSKKLRSVWLKIQLQRLFNVAYTEIYFRDEGTLDRMAGFSIYAYDDEHCSSLHPKSFVYRHDPMTDCPSPIQNITINRLVRQIVFTNNRPDGYKSVCPGNGSDLYTSIEICEIKVMGCDAKRYSPGCVHTCPSSCESNYCDVFNGSCIKGCPNPNALTVDCIECGNGQYILNRECVNCTSYCKGGSPCNKLNGKCDNGCDNHWVGDVCQECEEGYHGDSCSLKCGHCANNETCDKQNGSCHSGCLPHFLTARCEVCEDGFYNASCTAKCGQCINGDICDKNDGSCVNGCIENFLSPLCQDCIPYKYGPNCAFDCGHCKHGGICSSVTGLCIDGCDDGWTGDLCVTEQGLTTTGVVALSITSALLGIACLTISFLFRHVMKNQTIRQRSGIPLDASQRFTDLTATKEASPYTTPGAIEEESSYEVLE